MHINFKNKVSNHQSFSNLGLYKISAKSGLGMLHSSLVNGHQSFSLFNSSPIIQTCIKLQVFSLQDSAFT